MLTSIGAYAILWNAGPFTKKPLGWQILLFQVQAIPGHLCS
jgi:hypothetical protein